MTFDDYARRLHSARQTHERSMVVASSVPSTNDLAKRLAREHLRDGRSMPPCDIVAWGQTSGRGRSGKAWSSPPGSGVWATQIRPITALDTLQLTPLAVGVGIARALEEVLGGRCRLAWPNDVMVGGRKVAGILVESVMVGEQCVLLIGFGVNHHPAIDRFEAPAATSVRREEPGHALDLADLAIALLEAVDSARALEAEALLGAYRALSAHRPGDLLTCRDSSGLVAGTFSGFDERGFLLLSTRSGDRVIAAAEMMSHVD